MNEILHQVILHILRPLIRILHRKGIAFGEFSQIARGVYVEAAEQALSLSGEKVTTSRIAITTGLTRKDVAQLRQNSPDDVALASQYNRGVKVVSGWINDVSFHNEDGSPAALPIHSESGQPDFERLVSLYSGDMPYRAMLKELQQGNIVAVDDAERVHLLADAYVPHSNEQEQLSILGQDVALLINTIGHNLQAKPDDLYFQRKVRYDNLPVEAVAEFKQLAGRRSMDLLLELNEWLAAHDRDTHPDIPGHGRMSAGVGIFYFDEPVADSGERNDDDKDASDAL